MTDTPLVVRAYNLGLKVAANFYTTLSEEEVAYYEAHLGEIPIALKRGFVVPEKFALFVELGIITVPEDYDHATRLATFRKKNRKKFYYYNDAIIDANFPNPSRVLKPGDRLRVQAFQQIVPGTTTSEERTAYLRQQPGNVFVGAQGTSLVFEQKRDQLPKGKWYASFDEKDRLRRALGYHHVPYVNANSDGGFSFYLGNFELVWRDSVVFLCFRDESLVA